VQNLAHALHRIRLWDAIVSDPDVPLSPRV